MNGPPVFLQTGFRTGGTWFWSRFRELPEVVAFCEPLNELLAGITADWHAGTDRSTADLNHPTLRAPYFHEFSELIHDQGVGVKNYQTAFGLLSYFGL